MLPFERSILAESSKGNAELEAFAKDWDYSQLLEQMTESRVLA